MQRSVRSASLSERESLNNDQAIPFDLGDYLPLVDLTGRIIRSDKRGAFPAELVSILQRLGVDEAHCVDKVKHFGRRFQRFVGRVVFFLLSWVAIFLDVSTGMTDNHTEGGLI